MNLIGVIPVYGDALPSSDSGIQAEMEYYLPTDPDRKIQTVALSLFWEHDRFPDFNLTNYVGITADYAWGNIVQDDIGSDPIRYDNDAFGIGPAMCTQWAPFSPGSLPLSLDALGGILVHNRRFPAGGDYYNFIWRIGPTLKLSYWNPAVVKISLRVMHISNSQGITKRNPAYNAAGFSVHISGF